MSIVVRMKECIYIEMNDKSKGLYLLQTRLLHR